MGIARTLAILAVAAVGSAAVPAAVAQNVNAEPNYGTVNLRSGFLPDPHIVALQSGGDIDVSRLNSNCRGFITDAPDVRLNYTAGDAAALHLGRIRAPTRRS